MLVLRHLPAHLLTLSLGAAAGSSRAQLILDHTPSPAQVLQDVLLGPGVTVSNVTFNGAPASVANGQAAYFDGSDCVLQLDSGLLLATGMTEVALGPNTTDGAQVEVTDNFFTDEDLDDIAGSMAMNIACLEFDFVPTGDSISFAYSFASEEYLEWVTSIYNDAFGFFLSGPGISGPFENDAVNLAVVPGSLSYVSVNTINDLENTAYYQDNGDGFTTPYSTDPYYIQFDGFTVGLRAGAAVQCGQTYHIKMIIGDVGDPNWDSGVFIVGGSFTSNGGLDIAISTTSGDTAVTEGCDQATITITRSGTTGAEPIVFSMSGAAGIADISGVPEELVIPDGQSSVSFTISITNDGELESPEDLVFCASSTSNCGSGSTACAALLLSDTPPLSVTAPGAVSDCNGEPITLTANTTGGDGAYTYAWSTGATTESTSVPDGPGSYSITVNDACGNAATALVTVTAACDLVVPNVFTPNGDGVNDVFAIEGIELLPNQVRIYNRWGVVVYEATNYTNDWNGGGVSDGTYFYEVTADGVPDRLTGHLTILNNRN